MRRDWPPPGTPIPVPSDNPYDSGHEWDGAGFFADKCLKCGTSYVSWVRDPCRKCPKIEGSVSRNASQND